MAGWRERWVGELRERYRDGWVDRWKGGLIDKAMVRKMGGLRER